MSKLTTVNAVTYWACLSTLNELSGKYQVDLSGLSDNAVNALRAEGLTVRNKEDDRGNFITVKSNNPIKAYDVHGDEIGCLVGNGSKVKAVLGHYDWKFQQKAGRSPSLLKLVITDLSVYDPAGESGAVDFEGAL